MGLRKFFRSFISALFEIDDTPQKIALGFGLGVFLGVFPGTGPVASLVLAVFLKVNRASALLGSILTNTWLSIPVFVLAIHIGSWLTGVGFENLYVSIVDLGKHFEWTKLLQLSFQRVIFPFFLGYGIVAAGAGVLAYAGSFLFLLGKKTRNTRNISEMK